MVWLNGSGEIIHKWIDGDGEMIHKSGEIIHKWNVDLSPALIEHTGLKIDAKLSL